MGENIGSLVGHRQGCLLAQGYIGEAAYIRFQYLDRGIHTLCTQFIGFQYLDDRRLFKAADNTDDTALGHGACKHAHQISRFFTSHHIGGGVLGVGIRLDGHELGIGKL